MYFVVWFVFEEGCFVLYGWVYDIELGCIDVYDGVIGWFVFFVDYFGVCVIFVMLFVVV